MFNVLNRRNIPCINPDFVVVEMHYSRGHYYGKVASSHAPLSPVLETVSWDENGVCLTNRAYDVGVHHVYERDFIVLFTCMNVS